MKNNIITRFAPSPTGFLHIGGVRTALFSYLFAKHNKGEFLLRIEDTDNKRLMLDSITSIKDGLKWLGLENDGFSVQSENIENHLKFAAKLLSSGFAYFCFCLEEDLEKEREQFGHGYKYSGKCKGSYVSKSESDFFEELKKIYSSDENSIKPVLRFDSSKFEKIEFDDLISGHSVYQKDNLDDFILIKANGIPTFMFAVVVDDISSGVTHIIRGNDHHTNTAKHLMIYDALSEKRPVYAHLPLIMSEDGTKMSKRKNAVDIMEYKKTGFLPEALLNYLLLLGFSPSGGREFLSLSEMISEFEISKVHNSPARFDLQKLKKINQHYMIQRAENNQESLKKILEEEDFFKIQNSCQTYKFSSKTKDYIFSSLKEIVKRIEVLLEVLDVSTFYFENWIDFFANDVLIFINQKTCESILTQKFIDIVLEEFNSIKNDFTKEEIDQIISRVSENLALKKGEIMKLFRAIFTGIFNSYSISFIISVLGFEESISRLKVFSEKFLSKE